MNVAVFSQKKTPKTRKKIILTLGRDPIAQQAHKAREQTCQPTGRGLEAERYAVKSHRKKDEALPCV